MNIYEFWSKFLWSVFLFNIKIKSYQQYSCIGSDNGLVTTRQQAIIWTNNG